MSTRTAAKLAWSLAALTVALMVGAVFLVWLGRASPWRVDGQFSLASMVVGVLSHVGTIRLCTGCREPVWSTGRRSRPAEGDNDHECGADHHRNHGRRHLAPAPLSARERCRTPAIEVVYLWGRARRRGSDE